MPIVANISIAEVVQKMGLNLVKIKWPNDIIEPLAGLKLGGVICDVKIDLP